MEGSRKIKRRGTTHVVATHSESTLQSRRSQRVTKLDGEHQGYGKVSGLFVPSTH